MKEPSEQTPDFKGNAKTAIFFDLDDTLAFELDFIKSGFRAVDNALSPRLTPFVEPGEIELVMSGAASCKMNHYDALQGFLESVLPDTGSFRINPLVQEAVEICRNHEPDEGYQLRPGVSEMLEKLNEQGIAIGLITDGRHTTQRNKIKALGLDRTISENLILISEEVGSGKESDRIFRSAMERVPQAGRLIYVGDNPGKDFFFPKQLGWETVRIAPDRRNIHFPYAAADTVHNADRQIESFETEILLRDE